MPPPAHTPLPLAPDRAALSNRISLLISNQSSFLKTLNPPSSSRPAQPGKKTTTSSVHSRIEDDEELWKGNMRPNEGVGYVSEKPTKDTAKEDRMLRGKLLGKRKGGTAATLGSRKLPESESDEDEGRSSLGKRKRPRRAAAAEADTEAKARSQSRNIPAADSAAEVNDEAAGRVDASGQNDNEKASGGDDEAIVCASMTTTTAGPQVEGGQMAKNKKKNKKKKKKANTAGT